MSKLNCFFKREEGSRRLSQCLLALRVVVGAAFIMHGLAKAGSPFSWMPGDAGVPAFLQFLAMFAELGGGVALIIGFLVPLASLGLIFTMLAATTLHAVVLKDPFVSADGGGSYELALLYLVLSVMFFCVGPGRYSLDHKVFK